LSSPSGRGVVVHEDGTFAGTITASEVLARIEARAEGERQQAEARAADLLAGGPASAPGAAS
jgi:hypothetical protein